MEMTKRKIRPDAVWVEVRKAWEGGETARAVARRYDVGVPALWKRREAEGWKRPEPGQGPIEPAEGWDLYARSRMEAFETRLREARELVEVLWAAVHGGPGEDFDAWHLGFVYHLRAREMGAEAAAADHAKARGQPWAEAVWDDAGRLRSLDDIDRAVMRLYREDWRVWAGLPPGAAPDWP